ncbi:MULTISPECIES: PleD family two-component system response regulator [unclassified Anabaena]|uniref:response regulator n=1 Tax=unclassified Anabaena TaxID=2619674 RepID=UPI0008339B3E|nr:MULTISPECIES: PleD family two-component system response regulator [unclassified Anabaena]
MSGISPYSIPKKPPVVLVADDDNTIRKMLRTIMEQEGYRVVEVTNGKQCLDAYKIVKPDIVLLDAVMPEMDGFTCCQELLQIARNNLISSLANLDTESGLGSTVISKIWERTPILMITSLNDEESVDRAFAAGATDYVTKPINWAVLRQRLRRLLQQAQIYKQLEEANLALQQLANVDGLTNLANRRRFDNYLNTQWINLAQEEAPMSLILCDLDFFKFYNDQYGHPAGDVCLQKVGTVLSNKAEKHRDLVARYGGEEFAVIMPYTHSAGAVHVASSMHTGVSNLRLIHEKSTVSQYVTLSMGVATIIPSWKSAPSDLIAAADKALYEAKAQGRNRICQFSVEY